MHHLDQILIVLGCGCVLPIMVVWFMIRESMMDIEELMKKISPKKKLLKEKLLSKLLWGGIIAFLGIALLGYCIVQGYVGGMPTATLQQFSLFGAVLLGIGIAFLINYYVGRKLLAKEIDAEEKLLVSQAENK